MAEDLTINQVLQLQGADKVAQDLGDLGDIGLKAFQKIADAVQKVSNLSIDTSRAQSQLKQLDNSANQTVASVEKLKDATDGLGDKINAEATKINSSVTQAAASTESSAQSFVSWGLKIGGVLVAAATAGVAAATSFAKSFADIASEIDKAAEKAGISVQAYQRLRGEFSNAGIEASEFGGILDKLVRSQVQAGASIQHILPVGEMRVFQSGVGDLTKVLYGLGTGIKTVTDLGNGMTSSVQRFADSTVTIIGGPSRALTDFSENTKKAGKNLNEAFAQLGLNVRDVVKLNPDQLLQVMAEQFRQIPDGAAKSALAMKFAGSNYKEFLDVMEKGASTLAKGSSDTQKFTDAEIKAGSDLKDSTDTLSKSLTFLKGTIGAIFAPGAQRRADWLNDMVVQAQRLLDEFLGIERTKEGLTKAGGGGLFAGFDLDKFQSFLQQKGEIGLATAIGVIKDASTGLAFIWTNILVPAGKAVFDGMKELATKINEFFGTKINASDIGIVSVLTFLLGPINAVAGALTALFTGTGPGFDALRAKFKDLGVDIDQIAKSVKTFLRDSWDQLVTAFTQKPGGSGEGVAPWARETKDFLTSAPGLIGGVAVAFLALRGVAGGAAAIIARVFGVQLTGDALLATIAISSFTGVLRTMFFALGVAGIAVGLFVSALRGVFTILEILRFFVGTPVAIAIALGVAALLIINNWEAVSTLFRRFGIDLDDIVAKARKLSKEVLGADIGNVISGQFKQAKSLSDEFWASLATKKSLLQAIWDTLAKDLDNEVKNFQRFKEKALPILNSLWEEWLTGFKTNMAAWGDFFDGIINSIKQKFQSLIDGMISAWQKFKESTGAGAVPGQTPEGAPGPGTTPAGILGTEGSLSEGMRRAGVPESTNIEDRRAEGQVGDLLNQAHEIAIQIQNEMAQAFITVLLDFGTMMNKLIDGYVVIAKGATDSAAVITDVFTAAFDTVAARILVLTQSMQDLKSTLGNVTLSGPGFAGGGFTGFGGTLEPAGVVHREEYVQPAKVVRQPGVLSFMEALRQSGGNLGAVIQNFRGYVDGGLIGFNRMSIGVRPSRGGSNDSSAAAIIVLNNKPHRVTGQTRVIDSLEREARTAEAAMAATPSIWDR